jgi:hypothetical protein
VRQGSAVHEAGAILRFLQADGCCPAAPGLVRGISCLRTPVFIPAGILSRATVFPLWLPACARRPTPAALLPESRAIGASSWLSGGPSATTARRAGRGAA